MLVCHTEINKEQIIHNINGQWYHIKDWESKEMVLYKSLYDNHITYARPIDMFLSEVDHKKYPNIKQK